MNKARLTRLENTLAPAPPRIRAALAWAGRVNFVLIDSVEHPAPAGMTVAELPGGCEVFQSNPETEIASLYLRTDGVVGVKRVLGIGVDEFLGGACP